MKRVNTKLNEKERLCLEYLAEMYNHDANCTYFRVIAEHTGLEERQVKRAVRSLARKGLAEYVRGLFNDDCEVAGSGYCATLEGALLVRPCTDCKVQVSNMNDGRCNTCWHNRPCKNCGKPYKDHKLVGGHMQGFEEALNTLNTT